MTTLNACPNCGSNNFSLYKIITDGVVTVEIIPDVTVNTTIVTRYNACQECSLIFQNPRLSDAELDKYYSTGFYRKTINPPPEGIEQGEINRAITNSKIIKEHLGTIKNHLDVGCGFGYLLEKVGAKIKVGIESDPMYPKIAGIKIYAGIDKLPKATFDLVSAIHTLEHVPYPREFLKKMKKFAKKDGYVVIEVPSWKTRGGPLGFAHLSYFEPDVLRLMCKRVGLEVVTVEYTPHLLMICKVI